jgi:hypothetical protein
LVEGCHSHGEAGEEVPVFREIAVKGTGNGNGNRKRISSLGSGSREALLLLWCRNDIGCVWLVSSTHPAWAEPYKAE